MIARLLVANRGEIALRIFRAARELGIETVGLLARGDERAIHLQHCDRTVRLGADDPRAAFLDIGAIVEAARAAGVDAIHPGYGFVSENPEFARRVEKAGMVFVGPAPETMEAFGVKTKARAMMDEAGVPTVPGTSGPVATAQAALSAADRIGYPVVLKASYGGGGRGIRVVPTADALPGHFESAAREAAQAFGNGELFLEKFLVAPRHIEVQIMGDGKGGAIHFFERDCSMQRRNQKLIEESPAPNLEGPLRARLLEDAVRAAKAGRYRSAGTVEFLVEGGKHYFLEVNARLQVEHPVSEAVTGYDLVKAQLAIAAGEGGLPAQGEVTLRGHSIECRVNAEDPRANFMPSPGRITYWMAPSGPGVRVDAAGYAGGEVSPAFDSLLAKVIVHAPSREAAIARMRQALSEFVVAGVKTTIPFHKMALASGPFARGEYSTSTVAELGTPPMPPLYELQAAALAAVLARTLRTPRGKGPSPPGLGERPPAAMRASFGPQGRGWFHEL